jgi:hypothetical protein
MIFNDHPFTMKPAGKQAIEEASKEVSKRASQPTSKQASQPATISKVLSQS